MNEAVERGHRGGILTCASLMVGGPAAADAVERARRLPGLGVGLHLVLVEGRPTLPPEQVSRLVDGDGRFRRDMVRSAIRMTFDPVARRQLGAEIEAQFAAFAATGLPLDHVNAHKHFHLHPTIATLLLRIGRRYGMRAVRAPVEPRTVLAQVDATDLRRDPAEPWARLLRRRLRRAGMTVPDQVFGLAWSGHMTAARIGGLIDRLPDGLSEIYLHPATHAYDGSAPGYDYPGELAALTAPDRRERLARRSVTLGRFADQPAGVRA